MGGVVMISEDKKEEIRDEVLRTLIDVCTSYSGLKDLFQDNIDDQGITLNKEEEEYAYDLINMITENEEIRIKIEELIVEYFDQEI